MRHRGTAYMRAIQHFYKKFGKYPNKVEDLENTNNLRFLRKRYTDPMSRDPVTGKEKDFKFLHQQDISLEQRAVFEGRRTGQNPADKEIRWPEPWRTRWIWRSQGGLAAPGRFRRQGGWQPRWIRQFSGWQPPRRRLRRVAIPETLLRVARGSGNSNSESGGNIEFFIRTWVPIPMGFNGPTFGGGPILGVASTNKKDKTFACSSTKPLQRLALHLFAAARSRRPAGGARQSQYANRRQT
jgi:hypothetical protein